MPESTLIITGASRGIGAATARLAGVRGYAVAVNFVRDQTAANAVVDDIVSAGGRACAIQGDVGSEPDLLRLFETAERSLGPIRALVNNAAITGGLCRAEAVTAAQLEALFRVNVIGTILCSREAVRRMSTVHGGAGGPS